MLNYVVMCGKTKTAPWRSLSQKNLSQSTQKSGNTPTRWILSRMQNENLAPPERHSYERLKATYVVVCGIWRW